MVDPTVFTVNLMAAVRLGTHGCLECHDSHGPMASFFTRTSTAEVKGSTSTKGAAANVKIWVPKRIEQ